MFVVGCSDPAPQPSVPTDSIPHQDSSAPIPSMEAPEEQAESDNLELPVEITNSIGMKLKLIPAGEFMMGSPDSEEDRYKNEEPVHRVRITKSFYIGIYEVTRGQWKAVMGTEPWSVDVDAIPGADFPVACITWGDTVEFCKKLSEKDGRIYRLPTEAEWEYACRAGTTTAYSFGSDLSNLATYAWNDANPDSQGYVNEVGQKRPNNWGLYDMHGNVWEWCQDWYDKDYYADSPGSDPSGPSSGSSRVRRGGAWCSPLKYCRSTMRYRFSPDCRSNENGFRVVMVAEKAIE